MRVLLPQGQLSWRRDLRIFAQYPLLHEAPGHWCFPLMYGDAKDAGKTLSPGLWRNWYKLCVLRTLYVRLWCTWCKQDFRVSLSLIFLVGELWGIIVWRWATNLLSTFLYTFCAPYIRLISWCDMMRSLIFTVIPVWTIISSSWDFQLWSLSYLIFLLISFKNNRLTPSLLVFLVLWLGWLKHITLVRRNLSPSRIPSEGLRERG